jgi:hypothetical protein
VPPSGACEISQSDLDREGLLLLADSHRLNEFLHQGLEAVTKALQMEIIPSDSVLP